MNKSIKSRLKPHNFSLTDRLHLEKDWNANQGKGDKALSLNAFAKAFHYGSRAQVRIELLRGMDTAPKKIYIEKVNKRKRKQTGLNKAMSHIYVRKFIYGTYSAYRANDYACDLRQNKGARQVVTNHLVTRLVPLLMKHLSPATALKMLKAEDLKNGNLTVRYPSARTIYYYLKRCDIHGPKGEILCKPYKRPRRNEPVHYATTCPAHRTIEERPEEINVRDTPCHS